MLLTRERTALIVVDVQNGFCHPDGSTARMGLDQTLTIAAIPGCARLVAAAREAGVPVIYTRYVFRADYRDGGVLIEHLMPALRDESSLKAGTWDVELVDELQPREDEFVIDKNRPSAFYGTQLEPILTSARIDSLVVCGVTTNMCVETTARDASQRDYRTFTVGDATGEFDAGRHEYALKALGFLFGKVVTVDDVEQAWTGEAIDVA
jgi:ureidoacrylate peracid hydrolase